MRKEKIQVHLPADLRAKVEETAAVEQRSMSSMMSRILSDWARRSDAASARAA